MGLSDLSQISSQLSQADSPLLLAGFQTSDDCGAMLYNSEDSHAFLSSVDFITPVVDDPYIYGQIAASNALSDIFAMGGEAKSALNLLMWDSEHFSAQVASEILKGGLNKITESGALLLGGHTIKDKEQKYGLSVNGIVSKDRIWYNHNAQIGDMLVLSKPIGSGILSTAIKAQILFSQDEVIQNMAMLNLYAMRIAQNYNIHACTDITGFGLIGHALEMCGAKHHNQKSILFYTSEIPLFDQTREIAQMGIISSGSYANKNSLADKVDVQCELNEDIFYYDAQTSGGLLFALPFENAKSLIHDLRKAGMHKANIIGEILPANLQKQIILG